MFTAMYQFKDEFGLVRYCNAKIGGFKTKESAVKAVVRKSDCRTGLIQIGPEVVSIVRNGIEMSASAA